MSKRGPPLDNARMESFFRTLKLEQVYLTEYLGFGDAYCQIGRFLEEVHNRKRLHSALGYVPPMEFEATLGMTEDEAGHSGRWTVGAAAPELPLAPALT